jgi:uncharacterized membrane protein
MTTVRAVMRWLLAGLFVAAGVMHFVRPQFYVSAMPPYLPWHLELVYVSGVIEIALGVLLPVPRVRRLAAWGMVALMVAVFPANVHMAMHPDLFPTFPRWVLYARLPLQGVLIAWAWCVGRPRSPEGATGNSQG